MTLSHSGPQMSFLSLPTSSCVKLKKSRSVSQPPHQRNGNSTSSISFKLRLSNEHPQSLRTLSQRLSSTRGFTQPVVCPAATQPTSDIMMTVSDKPENGPARAELRHPCLCNMLHSTLPMRSTLICASLLMASPFPSWRKL